MQFYSGFSLKNEEYLFEDFITPCEYNICGFSYGAIKAFEEAYRATKSFKRVDKLILLSPAFFQTKPKKFIKLQLMGYKKDEASYIKEFRRLCFLPHNPKIVQDSSTSYEDLTRLLNYQWDREKLLYLLEKGVEIEVYLGLEDRIIDVYGAKDFFIDFSTVTSIKNANHFLQIN